MPFHMNLQGLDMVAVPMGMRCVAVAMPIHMGCSEARHSAFSPGHDGCCGWYGVCIGSNAAP